MAVMYRVFLLMAVVFTTSVCAQQKTQISPNDVGYRLGSIEAKIDNINTTLRDISKNLDDVDGKVSGLQQTTATQTEKLNSVTLQLYFAFAAVALLYGFLVWKPSLPDGAKITPIHRTR